MRILHVTYIFPPKPNVADGITQVVYQLTRALAKKGHDVTVYASNALDLQGKGRIAINSSPVHINRVKVRYFPYLFRYDTIFFTPSMFYSVRDDIKEFDIVHIHDARCLQCAITTYYAELFNKPIVFQPHGSFKSFLPIGRLRKLSRLFIDTLYAERFFKKASKIVALNQTEVEQYSSMGVPDEKIEVIPNGIDLSEYDDLPPKGFFKEKYSIDGDEKIVLYLGRIHKSKSLDLLVEAFSILSRKLDDVRLVIVGPDKGYVSFLTKLASSLKIMDKVLFTGFVDEEKKLAALIDCDVFVTPCFSGFPVAFLEACLAECPIVITTKADKLHWIYNGAGLVAEYSPTKLAEAIIYLITNEDVAMNIVQRARQELRNKFTVEKVVNKFEKLYANVAANTTC